MKTMKKFIIHSIPAAVSFIWLAICCETYNPIALKGPGFLKFYLILLIGFYASVMILKFLKESTSKITLYFMIFILIIGIVKLIKGIIIGKPVGFLVMILIVEGIVIGYQMKLKSNTRHKNI